MRVFRYELKMVGEQQLDLPLGAKLLSVAPGRTDYHIDMWATVPEVAPQLPTTFYIAGTGHKMPNIHALRYVGTAVMDDGLVWHVFTEPDGKAW